MSVSLDLVHTASQDFLRSGDGRWFPAPQGLVQQDESGNTRYDEQLRTRVLDEAAFLHTSRAHWLGEHRVRFVRGEHAGTWPDAFITAMTQVVQRHGAQVCKSEAVETCNASDASDPSNASDTPDADTLFTITVGLNSQQRCSFVTTGAFTHLYAEGDVWFVDPIQGPRTPTAPTSHHVQRRRLAACLVPAALTSAWDEVEPLGDIPDLDAADVQRVAQRVQQAMFRYLHATAEAASTDPRTYELWRFDSVSGVESTHVTLPYPEPAPR